MRKCKKCGSDNLSVKVTETKWLYFSIEEFEREIEDDVFDIDVDDYGFPEYETECQVICNDCGEEDSI